MGRKLVGGKVEKVRMMGDQGQRTTPSITSRRWCTGSCGVCEGLGMRLCAGLSE